MKAKYLFISINIFLAILIMPALSNAATYYVDATNGKDTNSGLSDTLAWKTIAKVNATVFVPGDQILFKRGELWREQLNVSSSGSSGKNIIISIYGSGNKPIILGSEEALGTDSDWSIAEGSFGSNVYKRSWTMSGGTNPNCGSVILNQSTVGKRAGSPASLYEWCYDSINELLYVYSPSEKPSAYYSSIEASTRAFCINIESKNYIVVDGLELRQSAWWLLEGNGNYGEFKNIFFTKNWSCGPNISGNHNQVHDCEVTNTSGIGQAITVRGNYNKIYNNSVHHNFREGIQLQMNSGYCEVNNNVVFSNEAPGIYVESAHDAKVHHNLTHNNRGWAIGVARETLTYETAYNVDIYYNVSYSDNEGIRLDDLTCQSTLSNINIYNNTIYAPVDQGIKVAYRGEKTTYTNCVIKNNIVYPSQNSGQYNCALNMPYSTGFTINNNCYYHVNKSNYLVNLKGAYYTSATFKEYQSKSGQDQSSITNEPLFTNISNNDFSLKKDSPCIDAGINVGTNNDFIGTKVPQGENTDIGAFEYKEKLLPPQNFRVRTQ